MDGAFEIIEKINGTEEYSVQDIDSHCLAGELDECLMIEINFTFQQFFSNYGQWKHC